MFLYPQRATIIHTLLIVMHVQGVMLLNNRLCPECRFAVFLLCLADARHLTSVALRGLYH